MEVPTFSTTMYSQLFRSPVFKGPMTFFTSFREVYFFFFCVKSGVLSGREKKRSPDSQRGDLLRNFFFVSHNTDTVVPSHLLPPSPRFLRYNKLYNEETWVGLVFTSDSRSIELSRSNCVVGDCPQHVFPRTLSSNTRKTLVYSPVFRCNMLFYTPFDCSDCIAQIDQQS